MNEVEKMYRNAGVESLGEYDCSMMTISVDDKVIFKGEELAEPITMVYPPFTAEKQLELIKWLCKNKNGFNVFYDTGFNGKEKHYWCCADQHYEDFLYSCHEKEFGEALAGLINDLWQGLTGAEKAQIKEILE